MMYDIAALQKMYGANFNTNSGNSTYSWSTTTGEMFINGVGQGTPAANKIFLTVWDGGGTDTYDFSNYATSLTVDLRPGQWSTVSAAQLALLHYRRIEGRRRQYRQQPPLQWRSALADRERHWRLGQRSC